MKITNFKPSEYTVKKRVLLFMFIFYVHIGYCQDNKFVFTGIYNFQEGENRSPMIGVVNQSRGPFHGIQLGLVNHAQDGVFGTQIGTVNKNGAILIGSSIGLVNSLVEVQSGLTLGLVNNATVNLTNASIGIVNKSKISSEGFQLGLVNRTENSSKGLRIGLVNISKEHDGLMMGLVNKADSLDGKAIGFINLLKQDVFLAISANYHYDRRGELQFKSGIEELFGIISYQKGVYNSWGSHAIGYGIGTKIPINAKFIISPEFLYHSQIYPNRKSLEKSNHKLSAYLNFVFPISNKVDLVFAKNFHYSKNNPYYLQTNEGLAWYQKPQQFWLSGHVGTTILLQ